MFVEQFNDLVTSQLSFSANDMKTVIISATSALVSTLFGGLLITIFTYFLTKKLEEFKLNQQNIASAKSNGLLMVKDFNSSASFIISTYQKKESEDEIFDYQSLKTTEDGRKIIEKFNMFFTTFDLMYEMVKHNEIPKFHFDYCDEAMNNFMKEKYYQQAFEYFISVDSYTMDTISFIKSKYETKV